MPMIRIHRDQAGFEHDVEQEQVLRREDADHQRFHQQERGVVFALALVDRQPAGADADRHQEHRQRDQHQRDAVDAQLPFEAREQRGVFGELPLRAAGIEVRPQQHAKDEIDQRPHQRHGARLFAIDEEAGHRRYERHQQHHRKDRKPGHCAITQLIASVRPISMTSA
jgi:hypothetical protein